jgi:hypothetical protein
MKCLEGCAMKNDDFKKLVAALKSDPALLHGLAFSPQKMQDKLAFLPAEDRKALQGVEAQNLLANALGLFEHHMECGSSCSSTQGCGVTSQNSPAVETVNPALTRAAGDFYRGFNFGNSVSCGPDTTCSCTSGTCGGVTCGGSTCDVTCSGDSCGNTCGDSCGTTSNVSRGDLWQERAFQFNQQLRWR